MGDVNWRRDKVALPLFPSPSSLAHFLFSLSPVFSWHKEASAEETALIYYTSSRLIAHSEDPDVDKPYQPPTGHVLGASKWFFFLFILSIFHYSGVLLISKCYNSLFSLIFFLYTGRWYNNSWCWGWKWKNSCWEFWTVIKLYRYNRTTSTSFISCLWWVRIVNRSFILLPCIGCSILYCFRKFSLGFACLIQFYIFLSNCSPEMAISPI